MNQVKSRFCAAIGAVALLLSTGARADLSLDDTFGTNGIATVNPNPDSDAARDVTLQADGKIVLAGISPTQVSSQTFYYVTVVRLTDTGAPDPTFGTNGITSVLPGTPSAGGGGDARAVAIDPTTQKIVIAGRYNGNDGTGDQILVMRFNTDGSIDTGFGVNGTRLIDLSSAGLYAAGGEGVAVQSDGKVIVSGGANSNFAKKGFVLRLLADGSNFDNAFATGGLFSMDNPNGPGEAPLSFKAVTVLGGGSVLAGGGPGDLTLIQLSSTGVLDAAFGTNGVATINVSEDTINGTLYETDDDVKSLAVLGDGSILVTGSAEPGPYNGNLNAVVARVTSAGAIDTTYGVNGFVVFPDATTSELGTGIAGRPAGDSVVLGIDIPPTQIGTNAILTSALDSASTALLGTTVSIVAQSDGSVVGGGSKVISGADSAFVAFRLLVTDLNEGAADTTPDAFSFTPQPDVPVDTVVTSNSVQITGINAPATVTVTGGSYSIGCTNPFRTSSSSVQVGQIICVRQTSAQVGNTATNTTLTVGGVSATFTSTTANVDVVPNPFSFASLTNVELSTQITSNAVTITGIDAPSPISIAGGQYSIGCNNVFTVATGRISNNQTVCVRQTSAAAGSLTVTTTLTIGTVAGTFSTTTRTVDQTPDAFSFPPVNDVALLSEVISEPATITGIDAPTAISITSTGQYSIGCNGSFTGAAGTITNGQTVCVGLLAAGADSTPKSTTLTIGGVSATFTATTGTTVPDAFTFTDQVGVPLSSFVYSDPVDITGITAPTRVEVVNGFYAVNCVGPWTELPGLVTPGTVDAPRTICVRVTSSGEKDTTVSAKLTVGGVNDTFSATTTAGGPLPGTSAMDWLGLGILGALPLRRRRRGTS